MSFYRTNLNVAFLSCPTFSFSQTDRRFSTFYLPKLLVVGLIWIAAVTLASWQEYNELQDPTYYYRLDKTNFMVNMACFEFLLFYS